MFKVTTTPNYTESNIELSLLFVFKGVFDLGEVKGCSSGPLKQTQYVLTRGLEVRCGIVGG